MVRRFIIPGLVDGPCQPVMLHHFNPHDLLLIVCYGNVP